MVETIETFAKMVAKILRSDRYVLLICDGDPGVGKSCFTTQLAKTVSDETGKSFSYKDNMTFLRKELKTWVDGDNDGKGKKQEYSVVLADELISMFFKRNWFDANQIDGIELLNKCRDRHLCIMGNVPSFYDLDSAIYSLVTFRVHIYERGRCWVYRKDRNPHTTDKWHRKHNEKVFAKKGTPYTTRGFICEIAFPNWSKEEKEAYYLIRNEKRLRTEGQRHQKESYVKLKAQRDAAINICFKLRPKLTAVDMSNMLPDLSEDALRVIRETPYRKVRQDTIP